MIGRRVFQTPVSFIFQICFFLLHISHREHFTNDRPAGSFYWPCLSYPLCSSNLIGKASSLLPPRPSKIQNCVCSYLHSISTGLSDKHLKLGASKVECFISPKPASLGALLSSVNANSILPTDHINKTLRLILNCTLPLNFISISINTSWQCYF